MISKNKRKYLLRLYRSDGLFNDCHGRLCLKYGNEIFVNLVPQSVKLPDDFKLPSEAITLHFNYVDNVHH